METPTRHPHVVAAAEAYVAREYPRVRNYLIATKGCFPQIADEVANDSSLIVLDRWGRLAGDPEQPGPPRSYLFRVASRLWGKRGLRDSLWAASLVEPGDPALCHVAHGLDLADALVERSSAAALVRAILPQLTVPHRTVLWLRHAEDFTTKETANIIQVAEGTVKTRLRAGTAQFRELAQASGLLQGTIWETR